MKKTILSEGKELEIRVIKKSLKELKRSFDYSYKKDRDSDFIEVKKLDLSLIYKLAKSYLKLIEDDYEIS